MCAPAAPAAPDPTATIAAQSSANTTAANQNAELNRVNETTPYGDLTYSQNGSYPDGTADYTASVDLSPQEQQIFNNQTQGQENLGNIALGMQGQVASSYAQPLNYSGAPGINSTGGNTSGINTGISNGANSPFAVQQAENAAYNQQTQYLNPQFAQSQEALSNNLINEGVTQGSQAANTAQQNLGLQENQAYGNAADQAVQAGQAEQNTLYGQGLSSAQLANSAQQQGYNEQFQNAGLQNSADSQYMQQLFAMTDQPLNEYNSLMTGAQVQSPTFQSVPQANVATTDVGGITNSSYQNQLAAYNANNQGLNNLFSLGGSLGSAAILSSDRRLKRDIVRMGEFRSGIPIYEYRYSKDGEDGPRYLGVMADEVAPVIPEAILCDEDGFEAVDYARLR